LPAGCTKPPNHQTTPFPEITMTNKIDETTLHALKIAFSYM
jgi:hypothetical protein